MKLVRRQFLRLTAGAAALPILTRFASALTYPTRPVRLIVPFPAGGGPDVAARLVALWLSDRLAQSFLVEDRPGAGGTLATETVVRAAPDGYTLLAASAANAVNDALYDKLSFNFVRDIAPVARIGDIPFVMVVHPSLPTNSVPEFISYAKANANKVNMASAGVGSFSHVSGALFKIMAGVDLLHVPYRANFMPDLLAGQTQVAFTTITFSIPFIRTGQLRALAVTSARRSARPCRTCRPSATSCRATRRLDGTASARREKSRARSSTSSTARSTPASPTRRSRRDLSMWAPSRRR